MTPSVTEDQVLTAMRAFLLNVLPNDVEVVQGQVNRVPEPNAPNYVVFWPLLRARLSTNVDTWVPVVETITIARNTRFDVQLDIHGPNAGDNASVIATLWRDPYAVSFLNPAIVTPLYASDGHQAPFVNGENQYVARWTMTLSMQVVPGLTIPAQFADTLAVTLVAL